MTCLGMFLCLLVLVPSSLAEEEVKADVSVEWDWEDGFKGKIQVPMGKSVNGGWQMRLEFSTPIKKLTIWRAKVACQNKGKVFGLTDMGWNKYLNEGYEMFFRADKFGPVPNFTATITANDGKPRAPLSCLDVPKTPCEAETPGAVKGEVELDYDWGMGFKAKVEVPVGKHVQGPWTMVICFSTPITDLEIWRAKSVCNKEEKIYFFENLSWNKDLPDSGYKIFFIAGHGNATGNQQESIDQLGRFIITSTDQAAKGIC